MVFLFSPNPAKPEPIFFLSIEPKYLAARASIRTEAISVNKATRPLVSFEGFDPRVEEGQSVKIGDPLIAFDPDFLATNAKSVVSIMGLEIEHGDKVVLVAEGPDAAQAIAALTPELASGLGDEGTSPAPAPATPEIAEDAAPALRLRSDDPNLLLGVSASPYVLWVRTFEYHSRFPLSIGSRLRCSFFAAPPPSPNSVCASSNKGS